MSAGGANRLDPVRLKASTRLALALALAALGLAACGSGDEGTIPRSDAEALLATLGEIEQKVQTGECSSAQTDATQFVAQVDQLPKDVGMETKEMLRRAGRNLIELTQDPEQCSEPEVPDTGATGAFGVEEDD